MRKIILLSVGLLVAMALFLGLNMVLVKAEATATVRYVATTGSDAGNDCAARANPCATVQHAVDVANAGDEIRIAAGTYTSGQRQVVYINKTITLRGGYATGNWDAPDWDANLTVLDAQGQGRVLVVQGGPALQQPPAPVIEGLHITGGDAADTGARGGGIFVIGANPTLRYNVVFSNTASTQWGAFGGGLYLERGNPTLIGNRIEGNVASTKATGVGGGLYLHYAPALMIGNIISGNIGNASNLGMGEGGGLYLSYSDATLSENVVQYNTANVNFLGRGGGVLVHESNVTLRRNLVQHNTASINGQGLGGGVFVDSVGSFPVLYNSVTLDSNRIISNTASLSATGRGGGVYFLTGTKGFLTNNVIAANRAGDVGEGDGLYATGFHSSLNTEAVFIHNTFTDNAGVAIVAGAYTTITATNTILSGHSVGISTTATTARVTADHTLWQPGVSIAQVGNTVTTTHDLTGDPAFRNPAAFNYHLGPASAAVDTGTDAGVTTDMDGQPHPWGQGYDIGADEFMLLPKRHWLPLMQK